MELKDLENPVRDVKKAIIYNIKQNAFVAGLIKNFSLNEPIVYETSVENLNMFDCPAVGVFYPLELPFVQAEDYAENIKFMPGLFFIDVVVEDPDFVTAQDNCLSLALYICRVLLKSSGIGLPDENGKMTVRNFNITNITEVGVNPFKTNIVQFAYRINLQAQYHWDSLTAIGN